MSRSHANSRIVRRLLFIVVGMFGFGFAMVPIYNVFCDLTGLNGKTANEAQAVNHMQVDQDRLVTVEFVASVNQDLPWEFRPAVSKMQVHPGEIYNTSYFARNRSDRMITGQAIPSVAPGLAASHFKKTECFCFTQQTFGAGEGREMPLQFVIDPELDKDVEVVTLAYTFFDTGEVADASDLKEISAIDSATVN